MTCFEPEGAFLTESSELHRSWINSDGRAPNIEAEYCITGFRI